MFRVPTESSRPAPSEVLGGVSIPSRDERAFRASVTTQAREIVPSHTDADAEPTTADTPVPPSPELEAVQAERVGEEPPIIEDLIDAGQSVAYRLSSGAQDSIHGKGQDSDVRLTPGKRLGGWVVKRLQMIKESLRKKAA